MRYALLGSALLVVMLAAQARNHPTVDETQFPPSYMPSGQEMYHQFCAACHGAEAKGNRPAASRLKTRPADLTTLAKRHPRDGEQCSRLREEGVGARGWLNVGRM